MNKIIKWVKSLFKKKLPEGLYNIHHPEMAGKTEFAFECDGVKYYRAVKDYVLPVGRFKWVDAFLYEVELRMNLKTLNAYLDVIDKNISGANGNINLTKVWRTVHAMRTRTKDLAWEPETVKRLASVVYFDETEDLRDYDAEYGKKKIESWDKKKTLEYITTRPMGELLNVGNFSVDSLLKYMKEAQEVIQDLTLEPEIPSSENS